MNRKWFRQVEKRLVGITASAAGILALATAAGAEDSGVLRGSPDDGTTKRILKTAADGALVFIGSMTLLNETDPQVGPLTTGQVPRWGVDRLDPGIIFDNGANVGIGTAAPGQKLEVAGTVKATTFQGDGSALTGIGTGLGGSGTSGTVSKWTGASSLGNSVILETAGGNIGIGTAVPSTKLEVVGTVKATAFQGDGSGLTGLPSGSQWTTSGANIYYTGGNVGIGTTNPDQKLVVQFVPGVEWVKMVSPNGLEIAYMQVRDDGVLRLSKNPTGASGLWLNNSDKVGIGTTNPTARLHVIAPAASPSGTRVALFETADTSNGTSIALYATKTHPLQRQWEICANCFTGGDMTFMRSSAFNNDPDTAIMHLANSGSVGIGTTNPKAALDVQTATPGLKVGGTCVSGTCPSDARLKRDIRYLSGALATIGGLKPAAFRFKDDPQGPLGYGLLAQDVRSVAPELVREGGDGYLRVDYSPLEMMLIEAVQEQQAILERLQEQVARFGERLDGGK